MFSVLCSTTIVTDRTPNVSYRPPPAAACPFTADPSVVWRCRPLGCMARQAFLRLPWISTFKKNTLQRRSHLFATTRGVRTKYLTLSDQSYWDSSEGKPRFIVESYAVCLIKNTKQKLYLNWSVRVVAQNKNLSQLLSRYYTKRARIKNTSIQKVSENNKHLFLDNL